MSMDQELRQRIIDYFDPWDLVEFLGLTTEDIVGAFCEEIAEVSDDVEELMEVGTR